MKMPKKFYQSPLVCNLTEPRPMRQARVEINLTGHKESDQNRILAASSQIFATYKNVPPGKCSETGESLAYQCLVQYSEDRQAALVIGARYCSKCATRIAERKDNAPKAPQRQTQQTEAL